MIQTIINEPLVLTSNSSPIVFDATNIRTRCAFCCNGGWLDYQDGNPIFKVFGNGYTGYYNAKFSATISSATAGVVAIGLYEDGILLPDTVRAVTIDAPDDLETISFDREFRVCPRGMSSITVASVPSVVTPTTPTTPITTEIPIIVAGTFKLDRSND
jgi:hypothetical protein